MPRLLSRLSRILKFFILSWLGLIGLWTFLPSPAITEGEYKQYIHQRLTSGKILRTIYKWDPSFAGSSVSSWLSPDSPRQPQHIQHLSDDCSSVLVDWRLVTSSTSPARGNDVLLLEIGHDSRQRLNLTDALSKIDYNNVNLDNESDNDNGISGLYVSDQITVHVGVGDEKHIINLPWFHKADAALIHNKMHGFTYDMDIRVVAIEFRSPDKFTSDGVIAIEIWKAAPIMEWEKNRRKWLSPASSSNDSPIDKDLVNIFKSLSHRSDGLLVSFSNIQPWMGHADDNDDDKHFDLSKISISHFTAELPSKTYAIRSWILIPLTPSLIIVFILISKFLVLLVCSELLYLLTVYCVTVLVCWLVYYWRHRHGVPTADADGENGYPGDDATSSERMVFMEWFAWFWLTRPVYAAFTYCCSCCCCCWSKRRRRYQYRNDENSWTRGDKGGAVIWGPTGPVYEK